MGLGSVNRIELRKAKIAYNLAFLSAIGLTLNFLCNRKLGRVNLLHSERPKLHTILAFLSAVGLNC